MASSTSVIPDERIRVRREPGPADPLEDFEVGDRIVVYWMQQAQRAEHNPALEHAVQQANRLGTTLSVLFCVMPDYPEASARHFTFMFQGLAETAGALERRGIAFDALVGAPAEVIGALGHRLALLVTDRGYLPIQRRWRSDVEDSFDGPIHEIETDVVVPVDLVTDKMETAARTIRPKIQKRLDDFVIELDTTALERTSVSGGDRPVSLARTAGDFASIAFASMDADDVADDVAAAVAKLDVAAEPGPVSGWTGGTSAAKAELARFCDDVLPEYDDRRNRYDIDPEQSCSRLSPYLHYGQISPVEVVLAAYESGEAVDSFVDEVVIRRELAINYVLHNPDFDAYAGLPDWARSTLDDHRDDERHDIVTAAELEAGETDDPVWNAIMNRIRNDGWVHNQLRMYWGKQIAYWTNTPEHAFRTLLELNNRWFLDGRDANSYANVAWCFGRHDQGFKERDVIGKVRPFTDAALKRKGDLSGWLETGATGQV